MPWMPIARLPEIGDRLMVCGQECVCISMYDARELAPELWGQKGLPNSEKTSYNEDDTIRAFKYASGRASFCIMKFSSRGGVEWNTNVMSWVPA